MYSCYPINAPTAKHSMSLLIDLYLLPEFALRRILAYLELVHFVRLAQCLRGHHLEILRTTQPSRFGMTTFDFPHDEAQRLAMIRWMPTHGLTIRLAACTGDTRVANVLGVMAPSSLNGVPVRELAPQSAIDSLYWLRSYSWKQPRGSRWLRMYWGSQWFISPCIQGWCGRVCLQLTIVGRREVTYMRPPRDVPVLSLQDLSNLTDVSYFTDGAVQSLELVNCPRIKDACGLDRVPTLDLSRLRPMPPWLPPIDGQDFQWLRNLMRLRNLMPAEQMDLILLLSGL